MHMHHDPGRVLLALAEKLLKDMYHEFHRGVIVVEHQYLVHGRLFRPRTRLDHDTGVRPFRIAIVPVAHRSITLT